MGFDNECILNIQSLPGEYFCPVCRSLVYPDEALQTQCAHLYCKPCLTFIVGSTRACPYDGYLVTEADAKPLIEVNKPVAEAICKIQVHCLYHRSGCTWQGPLSDCISHCTECAFGDSPVVCNRCGVQIVHRQVQEHALNCPGVQHQVQQPETAPPSVADQTQATQEASSQATTTLPAVPGHSQTNSNAGQTQVTTLTPQGVSHVPPTLLQAPTSEWYQQQQQQYQQYYQQYPGYDPYQQQYQHYDPYQQQQLQQQSNLQITTQNAVNGQTHVQGYLQPPLHTQSQTQLQIQPHPQLPSNFQGPTQNLPHSNSQPPLHLQTVTQPQVTQQQQLHPPSQPPPVLQQQNHPPVTQNSGPGYSQLPPHPNHFPPSRPPSHSQAQSLHRPPIVPQPPLQQYPHPQVPPQLPSALAVSGHQSYPQTQLHQQAPSGTTHPPSVPMQNPLQQQGPHQNLTQQVPWQLPSHQPPHVRPSHPLHSNIPMQHVQQSAALPPPGQHPGMVHQSHPGQSISHQSSLLPVPQQPQGHKTHVGHGGLPGSQGPPFMMQQSVQSYQSVLSQGPQYPYAHSHQSIPGSQGLLPNPSQRPVMMNQRLPHPSFPQNTVGIAGPNQTQANLSRSGYVQQSSQLLTGTHTTLLPSSAPQTGSSALSKDESMAGKHDQVFAREPNDVVGADLPNKERASLAEPKASGIDGYQNSVGSEGKSLSGNADKDALLDNNITSGASQKMENHVENTQLDKNIEEPVVKQIVQDESEKVPANQEEVRYHTKELDCTFPHGKKEKQEEPVDKNLPSESREILQGQKTILAQASVGTEQASQGVGAGSQTEPLSSISDRDGLNVPLQGQVMGLSYQNANPTQEISSLPSSGHMQMKNAHVSHSALIPERQLLLYPSNPQNRHDWATQRPLAPDRMVPPQVPYSGSGYDRRFPEPFLQQMPGQLLNQLRPQTPGQAPVTEEQFNQRIGKQPDVHHDAVSGIFPGPAMPHSYVRPPIGALGFHQSSIPPTQAGGPIRPHGEPFGGLPFGGPHSMGAVSHTSLPALSSSLDSEALSLKRPRVFDASRADSHKTASAEKAPVGPPTGTQSALETNGAPNRGTASGMQDLSLQYGFSGDKSKPPDERFGLSSEEAFRPLPEERFKPFPPDPGTQTDRSAPEEDLKWFPRPHMDNQNVGKYDGHLSSRPLDQGQHSFDRIPHAFNHDVAAKSDSRHSSVYPSLGPGFHPLDIGERLRFHDDGLGRKVDHREFLQPLPEFSRHRVDNFRSPDGEYLGIHGKFGSSSGDHGLGGQSRLEDLDTRDPRGFGDRSKPFNLPSNSVGSAFHESRFQLPGYLRRSELDGRGNLPPYLRGSDFGGVDKRPGHMHLSEPLSHYRGGEPVVPRSLPSHLCFADTFGQTRIGEPGFGSFSSHLRINERFGGVNLGSRLRLSESGFGRLPNEAGFFNQSDVESFDHSRKRKAGSTGWCRICKIDCETVEGLDLHSQTREHQKMAMDMVLIIKQENAKKKKPSSEECIPKEDVTKSQKAGLETKGHVL